MSNIEAISWPKEFPDLKRLDNLLRCGICYDYMKTPMMTSCSHNYCSLCIRKYMQYRSVCPTCFEETFEVTLRNNRPLDEIISVYISIRDKLIRHLKIAAIYLPKSGDSENNNVSAPASPATSDKKCDDSSAKSVKKNGGNSVIKGKSVVRRLEKDAVKDESENEVVIITSPITPKAGGAVSENGPTTPVTVTKIPSMFYSPKKSVSAVSPASNAAAVVSCPVCSVGIPERNINIHLDNCLARVNSPPKSGPKISKRDPIPKRVYSMMNEKDLRKWLKNYGLSTVGDKKALISRLQRYTVLYNSECDSDNPRHISEIIRQVEKEEKDEKWGTNSLGLTKRPVNRNTDQSIIEVENKKYIEKNKSHFESLINAMRERDQKYIKPTRPVNRIESDNEDDDSYCNKETVEIFDEPSTSENHQLNRSSLQHHNSLVNGYLDSADEISEIPPESPDLSKNLNYSTVKLQRQRFNKNESDDFSVPLHIEAEVFIDEGEQSSPVLSYIKTESSSELPELKVELPSCSNVNESNCDQSDESNESISLLVDYKDSAEENQTSLDKSCTTPSQIPSVSESQIVDPDFVMTESELVLASMNEESEDIFIPSRRSKRRRPDKAEHDLPKRTFRRKKANN